VNNKVLIEKIKQLGPKLFSALDLSFASFVCRGAGDVDNYPLFLASALISNASVKKKYTCLDLENFSDGLVTHFNDLSDFDNQAQITRELREFPIPENWSDKLRINSSAVSVPQNGKAEFRPLVLEGSLLYIYRDWFCERALAEIIRKRSMEKPEIKDLELSRKISTISSYFSGTTDKIDWQQMGIFAALKQNFTVISGGPGTGKTTVAAAVCAMFLEENPDIKITLCAPTGKAQARLKESIHGQIDTLKCSKESKERLKELPVSTIHRLLGSRFDSPLFKYGKTRKLVLDVLIVDEASMISQGLMKALLEAIPLSAKLIMLGDMRQLASVESGQVLRDFCYVAGNNRFNSDFAREFERVFPLAEALLESVDDDIFAGKVIELKDNHRFYSNKGLGICATAISALPEKPSAVAAEEVVDKMYDDQSGEIEIHDLPQWLKNGFEKRLGGYLKKLHVNFKTKDINYLDFKNLEKVEEAYELFNKFRVLCVHRRGMYGAENVNNLIEQIVVPRTKYGHNIFYKGKPVIINENNYAMGLYNGDTGIIWPDSNGKLKAFFPGVDVISKDFRSFDLNLLPAFCSAYAITVHKAQGSGFQQVLIITPAEDSPLMTREMIYTALSRAEKKAVFWTKREALLSALQSVTNRTSNLRNCLSDNLI
jgi:exodeoxyribonuclease V alpha subunit